MLIKLITLYSLIGGVDPKLALSVANVESRLNPKAIGAHGEVGLFQIRPQYSAFTRRELSDIHINIQEGIRKIKEAENKCGNLVDYNWIICYNVGVKGAKRIRHPAEFPYVKKVKKEMRRKDIYEN